MLNDRMMMKEGLFVSIQGAMSDEEHNYEEDMTPSSQSHNYLYVNFISQLTRLFLNWTPNVSIDAIDGNHFSNMVAPSYSTS